MTIFYRLSEKHWKFCIKVSVNVSIPIEWINDARRLFVPFYDYSSNSTLWIDQDIKQNAFARIVCNHRPERDQVDADNDSTRRATKSSSSGTYAADFYDPSIPDYVPLKYDFTLTRYTSWRCCNHCATRVETRDHQRSLSSTNRIWHRPNRPRGSPERVGERDARAMSS